MSRPDRQAGMVNITLLEDRKRIPYRPRQQ